MSVAGLRRRLVELSNQLIKLSEEVDAIEAKLASLPQPLRPFSYRPEGAAWGLGEIRLSKKPDGPISRDQYWKLYAQELQALIDRDDDPDYWLRRIERADFSLIVRNIEVAGETLIRSGWIQDRVQVPEWICPEQFTFDPDCGDFLEKETLEGFFHLAFPEAG